MKELIFSEVLYVMGKGTILLCSFKNNKIERKDQQSFLDNLIGNVFLFEDTPRKITGVETMKTLMTKNNYYKDNFGVVLSRSVSGKVNLKVKMLT